MVGVGRSTLAHPLSIQLHLSLSGKRTPPPGWIVGSPTGPPDLTGPLNGPVPWSPSLSVVQPQDPATLCCLSPLVHAFAWAGFSARNSLLLHLRGLQICTQVAAKPQAPPASPLVPLQQHI